MAISGRVPLLLVLGLVPVVLRPVMSTMWLWLLLVVLLTLADWLLAPRVASLSFDRRPVGSVRLGYPTDTLVVATNVSGRRVRALVRDAWQPSAGATDNRHRVRLGPGDRAPLRTPLQPYRRGDLRAVGLTVRSRGPLGLAAKQRTLDVPGTVRSLPPFESRKHLPSRLARLRELDGRAAMRVRGQGTEFDSLREYVRGDDVRSIDWRATARMSNVVVRTWQPERDRRVVLVLDTSRTSAVASRTCRGSTRPWTRRCCSPRSRPGPATGSTSSPATAGCAPGSAPPAPATSPRGCRTRWPTSSR